MGTLVSAPAPWYAHSDPTGLPPEAPGAQWQLLRDHLQGVAALCQRQAMDLGAGTDFQTRAYWAGLLHDLGKYQPQFQARLFASLNGTKAQPAPHAIHGASTVLSLDPEAIDLMLAIAGHHAGLSHPARDNPQGGRSLLVRLQEAQADMSAITLRALQDGIVLPTQPMPGPRATSKAELYGNLDLPTRMLASILVHADRLDTSRRPYHLSGIENPARHLAALERHVANLTVEKSLTTDPALLALRSEVFSAAIKAGQSPERLWEFQVPTGGGKTLAALAFALSRATSVSPRPMRVIYVLPFLSLIEQNAAVWRARLRGDDSLPAVPILEHHSGLSTSQGEELRGRRIFQEDWEAPIIITTTVRLFETLFGHHTSDLRRLRALAGSIIVLDEVQTLPRELITPFLDLVKNLSAHWGMTIVNLTATPPAFETTLLPSLAPDGRPKSAERWPVGTLAPVVANVQNHFQITQRVEWHWPICHDGSLQATSWQDIAQDVSACNQALVIVNLRKHAKRLVQLLSDKVPDTSLFHLSTSMCGAHRMEILEQIRLRLSANKPCLVVSTQLVEAGVDLDFPVLWRALAPLDSLVQAAGRCNREGRLGHKGGHIYVFEPKRDKEREGLTPAGAYTEATELTRKMILFAATTPSPLDPNDPVVVRKYFDSHYQGHTDDRNVQKLRLDLDFPEVSAKAHLIDKTGSMVLVPWREIGQRLAEESMKRFPLGSTWWRTAQPYFITLWPHEIREANMNGSIVPIPSQSTGSSEPVYVAQAGQYDSLLGFTSTTSPSFII